VDQEQFVSYAQCAARFPIMQFSISGHSHGWTG
jgi:hypothetical protein